MRNLTRLTGFEWKSRNDKSKTNSFMLAGNLSFPV